MILNLEQKKGNPFHLHGKVTVYAQIEIDPSDLMSIKHPISSMVHNGLLVAQGNFKEQSNLKDFLKSEMGISSDESMEEGLSQLLEKMNGIESALDPQKLKDRLENMGDLEEFIPTPAKIVPFHSEQEILDEEGDVFFTGIFKNVGNAVLSVNALPILYQARYREQEHQQVRNEIEHLINQIEQTGVPSGSQTIKTPGVNAEERLLKEFIPNMLYWRKEQHSFSNAEQQFRTFMKGYQFQEDVEAIVKIIGSKNELGSNEYKLLELYAKKIASIKEEDFSAAEGYSKEIQKLQIG
jgi:hypothetical protein